MTQTNLETITKSTILIVDDMPTNLEILFDHLQSFGFKVLVAENGYSAIKRAAYAKPDIILLDILMPDLDGFEVCSQLKAKAETKDIPVIFMTALDDTVDKVRGFEVGAVDYITKPINPEVVKIRLIHHLSVSKLQQQLKTQNKHLKQENAKRKQAEQSLQKTQNQLEQRVKERTEELAKANAILEKEIVERKQAEAKIQSYSEQLKTSNKTLLHLDKLKNEFLVNVSRQLRTPLNGIIGITESLIDSVDDKLTPKQIYNLSMVVSSGRRLANLVNDILDLSKLKHQDLNLDLNPIDMRAITEVVLSTFQTSADQKSLKLINSINTNLPLVKADERRMQQIIHNLIDNAIKFTESGTITVSAVVKDDMLAVKISDTGIGIAPEKFETIFQSFEEISTLTNKANENIGLGLPITKQLIELHGGSIELESTLDQGSQFTIMLPLYNISDDFSNKNMSLNGSLSQNETSAITGRSITPPVLTMPPQVLDENKEFTILVVDDDLITVQILTNYLSLQNYAVIQAFDGLEAIEALAETKPDLILLDIMMPKVSGYEVCRKVRESHSTHDLPIILLTNKDQIADLLTGFEIGANDYLTKPINKNELLARVKTHLRLAKINIAYGRFVPQEFLRFLGKESIIDVNLGDQVQREMTIFFSDIRAFTTLSETMNPQENFSFLNTYLGQVSPIIRQHNGFIDKYIGDAIMALFPERAEDALLAAISIGHELPRFNEHWEKRGNTSIKIGIGLHTGSLMMGTIGEEQRMESTVISDAVNLASRMEGLTKLYGASIIISEQSLFSLDNPTNYHFRFLDRVQVKGKKDPVSVFEIFNGDSDDMIALKLETRTDFERGLLHYHSQEFGEAKMYFEEVLKYNQEDKAAHLYLQRATHFINYGVPPGWEGIEALSEK